MITCDIIAENTSGAASLGDSRLRCPVSGSGSGLTITRSPMTSAGTSIDVAYSGIASVVHSAETKVDDAVCPSLRSTSAKATLPPTLSVAAEPAVFANSVKAPAAVVVPATMVGVSLVPVMVTVTVAEAVRPELSLTT